MHGIHRKNPIRHKSRFGATGVKSRFDGRAPEALRDMIVTQALFAWIEQEDRSRLTREALADVDAGSVIDHHAVQAWADSLSTHKSAAGTALVD